MAECSLHQVASVRVADRVEITGAGSVRTVGDEIVQRRRRAKSPREPVVREAHGRDSFGVLRFVLGDPTKFGDGERGNRHRSGRLDPRRSPEFFHELRCSVGRAGVVPQQRRSYDVAICVETHGAVLLSADGDRSDVVEASGRGDRLVERGFPIRGVYLGAVGMFRRSVAHQRPARRVANHHLARLRGGVDPRDEHHVRSQSANVAARSRVSARP